MKMRFVALIAVAAGLGSVGVANATDVYFNSTECPTCVNGTTQPTTEWNAFGLAISNAYWYQDSRDTFDGMGLSIQTSPAQISLAAPSNGITFDYWVIGGNRGSYQAFDAGNNSLGIFDVDATNGSDVLGTQSFNGLVSSLVWSGTPGFVQVSTLRFASSVPEPGTLALLGLGLAGLGLSRRRKA